jgi:hypothetical protein
MSEREGRPARCGAARGSDVSSYRLNRHRYVAVALAAALSLGAISCGRTGGSGAEAEGGSRGGGNGVQTATGGVDFADLKNVCQPGEAKGATAQGVTDTTITLGTFTDFGFTKNREFIDAADVFTRWCNDAGGINGRKLAYTVRDAKLFEYRQRMLESCKQDFMHVGGGAAFDNTGVKDRLKCLMPEIPGQTVSLENSGSDLQVDPSGFPRKLPPYAAYFRWLIKEGFPDSAQHVGIIAGDIAATKTFAEQDKEGFQNAGGKVVYTELYPASGVADWTPYAQAIKSNGVKGLVFLGDFNHLPKLLQVLTDIGYQLSWVDANSNAYNSQYISLGGANLDKHPSFSPAGVYPLENAASNPSTKQLLDLYDKYAPEGDVTMPTVKAWSAWLLFAQAARDCGAQLTRKCVYDKVRTVTKWTGAGLHAPTSLDPNAKEVCYTIEQATPSGWKPADFKPNHGVYRCETETVELKGNYTKPVTMADAGANINDLK